MKKFLVLGFLLLALSLVLSACGGTGDDASSDEGSNGDESGSEETFTFKVGHSLTEEHPYQLSLEKFAENVKERTDGKVKFEIYPLSQLGAERECIESLTVGTVDMCLSSTAPLVNFYEPIGVLGLPFLFESRDHAYKVLDGEIGQELLSGLEDAGLVGLAWGENGFRHVTNSKKDIKAPEDLKGLKIRVQESPIQLDTFNAIGAQPTPMAWTEALTALQQEVVDAQENPAIVGVDYKLYEANQTHMTLTGHVYSAALYLFSKMVWDTVPADYQEIIKEEAKKAGNYERELITKMEEESLKTLKEKGVKIIEDVDKEPFRKAVESVYDKYGDKFGADRIQKISEMK
jgi:tripartite ATP-independent transporter DctP family solute receptor